MKLKLFIGIELGTLAKKVIVSNYGEFRKIQGMKIVPAENLHITLKFLGDVDERKLPVVKSAVRDAFENSRKFDISIRGASAFPNENRAKVIWAKISRNRDVVSAMHQKIDSRLASVGFEAESRKYIPHVTFVRSKEAANVENILENMDLDAESTVESAVLFESKSSQDGVIYEKLYEKELI